MGCWGKFSLSTLVQPSDYFSRWLFGFAWPYSPRLRAGAASGLAEMELVSLEGGRVLTFHQWLRLEQGYLVYRAASTQLGAISLERRKARWRQRPKGHSLEHQVSDFHHLNPRYTANYLDEDFVRRSKRIAIKSDARFVSQHVIQTYAVSACLRWTKMLPQ